MENRVSEAIIRYFGLFQRRFHLCDILSCHDRAQKSADVGPTPCRHGAGILPLVRAGRAPGPSPTSQGLGDLKRVTLVTLVRKFFWINLVIHYDQNDNSYILRLILWLSAYLFVFITFVIFCLLLLLSLLLLLLLELSHDFRIIIVTHMFLRITLTIQSMVS